MGAIHPAQSTIRLRFGRSGDIFLAGGSTSADGPKKGFASMRLAFLPAFLAGLLLVSVPVARSAGSAADADLAQAKAYLKDYLKALNRQYPLADWEKQLAKARKSLEKLKPGSRPGEGFDRRLYKSLESVGRDVAAAEARKPEAEALVREMHVSTLVARIESMFAKAGRRLDPEARAAFQRALMPYEQGSIKPKQAFLDNLASLGRDFRDLQTEWLYAYAQDRLGRRVEEHLQAYNFARNEALYDDFSLQLDYWTREIEGNAVQAHAQLEELSRKYDEARGRIRQNLDGLLEALHTDMLFSDLLEHARKQDVEFTIAVEEKIDASLKERNQATLEPIHQRLAAWNGFASRLHGRIGEAREKAEQQRSIQLAREESERRERERMEALRLEQERIAREQKEKFKQTLTALKTFTFKSETTVELDDQSRQALKTKAGFLKTSYVRSGSRKLQVDKGRKFSDTLALVQKFSVEDGGVDFSKMSLQERTSQSAYTYASPSGRTSNADLEEFVAEVALGSFSTQYSFLSYLAPARWKPGRVGWVPDRAQEKAAQDREFSYVDLVVDAHRKRPGAGTVTRQANTVNLPANMIVIFDPAGAIIRYQTFSDIGQVSIRQGDLVGGRLHYKFLNYSADRRNIYLNGIDQEMKVSAPGT